MKCKYLENQVTVRSDGQYRLCCVSVEPDNTENINTHTPEDWRNSKTHKNAREMLGQNEWPAACIKCKTQEEANVESKRTKAKFFGPGISHLDLRLGNSCNLKCISCWNMSSSSIAEEEHEMVKHGIPISSQILDVTNINWSSEENFKKLENLPLQEVYLTGGEPMMVRHIPEFLERLDPSTHIRFSTNCTVTNPKLEKVLKKFHIVSLSLSLDAVDKKIEYIRYGSRWKEIEENAKRFSDNFMINIAPTISIFNAWFYDDIHEYADKNNWHLYENLLLMPSWLSCKNAPMSLKKKFQRVDPNWYKEEADPKEIMQFKSNINRLDQWRKIRIREYLPTVADAYDID
jgi:organic radical activating enzyme